MRDHVRSAERGSEKRAAGAARPSAAKSTEAVSALLALQRAAGNATVTTALRAQRSAGDPGNQSEWEAEARAKHATPIPLAGANAGGGLPQTALVLQRLEGNTVVGNSLRQSGPESTGGRHQHREGHAHHGEQPRDAVVQRMPDRGRGLDERLSRRVLRRLRIANDAIDRIQRDTRHAANQQDGLIHTLYNSSMRSIVQQHNDFWDLSGAESGYNREAMTAAKALYARSMICETAAQCTYSYLRRRARGEQIRMVLNPRMKHWFVIIGDESDDPSEWVVADPWPTQARAVEWVDHFCYTPDMEEVFIHKMMWADGHDEARHLAHQIAMKEAGWFVAEWDLSRLNGRTLDEIGDMLQLAGVGINHHQDDLEDQIMEGLAMVDEWPTNDIGSWPRSQLEVWCLAQIDTSVVRRLLARTERSGNRRDLREEIAAGTDEVRQRDGDDSWIWNIRDAYAYGRNP